MLSHINNNENTNFYGKRGMLMKGKIGGIISSIRNRKIEVPHIEGKRPYVYNRQRAKAYAEMYALTANAKEYPIYTENDCVNFVSQALVYGGMKMEGVSFDKFDNWFCYTKNQSQLSKASLTWRSSQYFRLYWGNKDGEGHNKAYSFEKMTVDEAIRGFENLYKKLKIGDVIQYGDVNDIAYHSQIIHAKEINTVSGREDIFVAQHSANRKHVSLYEYLRLLNNKKSKYVYIYHF